MKRQPTTTRFFYQNGKLVTVNEGGQARSILRHAQVPLAELQETGSAGLLATDQQGSVLAVEDKDEEPDRTYTAYGHDSRLLTGNTALGFNGEHSGALPGCYSLGNGYRNYAPALMRFHAADSMSPFDAGGLNSYAYCAGDPVNRTDPDGHWSLLKPRTWFRSPETKVRQRLDALAKLRPRLKEAEQQLQKYSQEYGPKTRLDLVKQTRLAIHQDELKQVLAKAKDKAAGIKKYRPSDEVYRFPDITSAEDLLKRTQRQRFLPPQQPTRTFLDPTRHRDDPYDDTSYWNSAVRRE